MIRHKIVALDGFVKPPPMDLEHDVAVFERTLPSQLPERMADATIVMTAASKVTSEGIESAPNLQLIICTGVGSDHIDKHAAREHGVTVCNVPAQNTESVSEHAFALYYGLRRKLVEMHQLTLDGGIWCQGSLHTRFETQPRVNGEEVLVVIGYGAIGKNIEKIGKALGMQVLVAERKDAKQTREGRTSFDQAIRQGTAFFVITPLDPDTRGMISTPELEAMESTALLVNVSRGGVVDENALVAALKSGNIAGAATDVFEHEPATKENCSLLDPKIPNLLLSPHVAWYSSKTARGTAATVTANVKAFLDGNAINVVVPGAASAS